MKSKQDMAIRMLRRLETAFDYPDKDNLEQCQRLYPGAVHFFQQVLPEYKLPQSLVDSLLLKLSFYLHHYKSDYLLASQIYRFVANNADQTTKIGKELFLTANIKLGLLLLNTDRFKEAKSALFNALKTSNHLHGKFSETSIRILNHLTTVNSQTARYTRALALARLCIKIYHEQGYSSSEHEVILLGTLAGIYRETDQLRLAADLYQQILERLLPEYPDELHHEIALAYRELSHIHSEYGHYQQALEFGQRSIAIYRRLFPEGHIDSIVAMLGLALVYETIDDVDRVIEITSDALDTIDVLNLSDGYDASTAHNMLGVALQNVGELEKAEENLKRSIEIRERLFGKTHHDLALPQQNLGVVYYQQGNYQKALDQFHIAYDIYKSMPEPPMDIAYVMDNIAGIYRKAGQYSLAIHLAKESLKILVRGKGADNLDVALSINNLATILLSASQKPELKPRTALKLCRYLEEILARLPAEFAQGQYPGLYYNTAIAQAHLKDRKQQMLAIESAVLASRRYHGEQHNTTARFLYIQAQLQQQDNELDAAEASAREAYDILSVNLSKQDPLVINIMQFLNKINGQSGSAL